MKNNQDIGSALKSKLEGLHNSPDDFVWDAIEEKLKKKKRRLIFWYFTFGLGVFILGIFIYSPFKNFIKNDFNDSKSQKQNIEVVEQKGDKNTTSDINFEDKNPIKETNTTLNIDNQSSNDTVSSVTDSQVLHKKSAPNTTRYKNALLNVVTSKKQKRTNSILNKNKSDTTSQSTSLDNTHNKNLNSTDNTNLKSQQKMTIAEERKKGLETLKEKASDSLLKTEDDVIAVSEDKKTEDLIDDTKKDKDSVTKRDIRWSINPQLIQSNYGAFNAKTKDNTSTNYGLLLGVRMTNNTFLRFGVRKLDLVQTVNNRTNSVSYLEFPLEVKYLFRDKKLNPYLTGGLSYFKLGDRNSESQINLEYGDNMSVNFGLGLEHKLFDRFYINLESNFNYQIEPITSNIDYTPYIFSISTGIDYRF